MLLEIIATLAAGLFAGAAIYIDLAEQPARKQIDTAAALTEWRPSYKRAAVVQPLLAGVGFLSAVAAWLTGASVWWLVGAVLLVAVIPYTLIIVFPTNNKLLDPTIDKNPDLARRLLIRWGRLHTPRSVMSVAALLIFMLLL
jgi:anthrone oxygenase-like protein